jgi:hypothetical protein
MHRSTKIALAGAATLFGLVAFALTAHAQPPGLGTHWGDGNSQTWTCLRDSLPHDLYDSTYCKMAAIRSNSTETSGIVTSVLGDSATVDVRLLIKFDISWIPESRVISRAIIGMMMTGSNAAYTTGIHHLQLYRVLKPWYETGVADKWTNANVNEAWTTAGAKADSVDWNSPRPDSTYGWWPAVWAVSGQDTISATSSAVADVASAYVRVPLRKIVSNQVSPILIDATAQFSAWHENRTYNNGLLLVGDMEGTSNAYITVAGMDHPTKRYRPVLWILTEPRGTTSRMVIGGDRGVR